MPNHQAVPRVGPNEAERLDALRRYHILDTPPEQVFDRITRLASRLFGMPISLVSLLDESRQWFKSRRGLDVESMPRDIAFCAHTIRGEGPMVVGDAKADPRFARNPIVTEGPRIRFYAGAPLRTPDAHALGTLCVIDVAPHHDFDAEKQAILQDLADLVMLQIESREMLRSLREEVELRERTEGELRLAQEHLRVSLAEKELLLREIHHRVKNNLQSVCSLLQVERARLARMPEALDRIDAVARRIVVIGRIHEQLYGSEELTSIDMREHLERLARDVAEMGDGARLRIEVEAEALRCGLETALPLGLIANELLVNSAKHAYPDGSGTIRVRLRRRGPDAVELWVEDDGKGADESGEAQGIGLTLVAAMAAQIDAAVSGGPRDPRRGGWLASVRVPAARFLARS